MIDLKPHELSLVQDILRSSLPSDRARVWVFGSRVKGTTKRASDLDLAVDVGAPMALSARVMLEEAFDEAPLAFSVDVVDLHNVSDNFRTIIDAKKVPLPGFET